MRLNRFAKYAWGVLIYNLLVILWGAYVRATGSGAGCGSHWPLCNGAAIPPSPQLATVIEFTHRLMSGASLIAVLLLVVWALRRYPRRHPVRFGAAAATFFILTEALIGAGLVLFGLVADNDSTARAVSMSLHLANTLLLLAFLTLTAWWATGGQAVQTTGRRALVWGLRIGLVAMIVLGVSGAVTALGDTLYPANSLREGLQQDFALAANVLIRLRVLHPIIAIAVGVYVILVARLLRSQEADPGVARLSRIVEALVAVQLAAGFVNVFLLAPVWMQLLHLLLADLVWIALVLLAVSVTAVAAPRLSIARQRA